MSAQAAGSLFWIALGALLMPLVSRRLRVPSAVGELLFGIVFGHHLLGLIGQADFIDFMAQIGFAFLMFSAGMEIDFGPLKKRRSLLLKTAWQWVILAVVFTVGGAVLLDLGPWPVLAVACVSVGLASVLLRERGITQNPMGQIILAAGLIGESLSIMVLTLFDFHQRYGLSPEFFAAVVKFTGIFALAYLVMRIFKFIIWWYPHNIGRLLDSGDPLELGVRMAVALLFIFVAAAAMLQVEAILGAFIAGALFGFIFQEREAVSDKINAMGQGFFVPFFFIVVGSHFNPSVVLSISPLEFGELLAFALAVKLLPSLLFKGFGLTTRETLASGILLSSPLTLTVAVAEVGYRVGAINENTQGVLIMIAITAGLLFPYLARQALSFGKKEKETESEVRPQSSGGSGSSRKYL